MKAVLQATVLENRWIPQTVRDKLTRRQAQFLALECKEAMYGGAAGGGKSCALLMGALQYVDEPGYHALILRRTFKQLDKPGSIMSAAREWLSGTKAKWNEQKHQWTFPSGATLTFGHMENANNRFDYQGSDYAYVGYDELTQFEEVMYRYLFSRVRRPEGSRIPMRMRSASNPGGVGHLWVKHRFIDSRTRRPGVVFVPAKLDDNPNLDREAYREGLAELDPVERARLEEGDWDAIEGGRFRPEWLHRYVLKSGGVYGAGEYHLDTGRVAQLVDTWRFCTVDPAASSEQTAKTDDPDYTVISIWGVTTWSELLWLDCHRFRAEIPDILPQIELMHAQWLPLFIGIEAVASNRAVLQLARRTPMTVRELSPGGKDKQVRATPAIVCAAEGKLFLPYAAHWLDDVVAELLLFTGGDQDAHDDSVDSASYAVKMLNEYGGPGEAGEPMSLGTRAY